MSLASAETRTDPHSPERLEQLAPDLARSHAVMPGRQKGRPLLPRLRDNERALVENWRALAQSAREGQPVSPAAEWLIDNFQIVEDQLREIIEDLPPGFYLELPKLAESGLPRVYALVHEYVERTERRFDLSSLKRFVAAYQRVQPLTLGELWAIAISLRLVLVDDLRVATDAIVARKAAQEDANRLADALLDPERCELPEVQERLEALARSKLPNAFAVQLLLRLRECDPHQTHGLVWLNERLDQHGTTPEDVVRKEHVTQVALVGPVRDSITSMRAINAVDWSEFVEELSLVEQELRRDTIVETLDFDTRDCYRHAVEDLARGSERTELQIATLVAERARAASGTGREPDPGLFLISKGRLHVEADIRWRPTTVARIHRWVLANPTVTYLGGIGLVSPAVLALPLYEAWVSGASPLALAATGLLATLPATELAVTLVNTAVTRLFPPRKLPKLALEDGVPAELRTMVAIPGLLGSVDEVRELVDRIEVHYLANDDGDLRFALVTDWTDAATERTEDDEALVGLAKAGISELNDRYGPAPGGGPRFFLLHRSRRWNPGEQRWMGWERKRGKLHELNRLLRGDPATTFVEADPAALAALDVRYVITLDSDTRLPRGSARRLVGTMAHPLNRPVHDATGRVVQGYGLLQPRITPTLPETGEGTIGQRVFCGPAGIDPYAFAVSDVYQDLFAEGSYVGKGIYDVDAFERALAGRIPENTALSHDLLEGLFVRAGLVSDVELFEAYPAHYSVTASRTHRWVRGDWQLLPWILGRGISPVGRWKMVDNLRRSLVPPALLATLLAGWLLPDARPFTLFVAAILAIPAILPVLFDLVPRRRGTVRRSFVHGAGLDLVLGLVRVGVHTAFLPQEAWDRVDAVARTLWRLGSRRRLLEWTTAAQVKASSRLDLFWFYTNMARGLGLAGLVVGLVVVLAPRSVPIALVLAAIWAAAPAIARWISVPRPPLARGPLDAAREEHLRHVARRTWRFFETTVTPGDNHLPPDNLQEDPAETIAHRTSPTNIGLYLLSCVAARDMGWIGRADLADRLEATLSTLERMDRLNGHFYNWYDTISLVPLPPRYVSTVDSGNLAGHLLVVQQSCFEFAADSLDSEHATSGIRDALALCRQAFAGVADDRRSGPARVRQLEEAAQQIDTILRDPRDWDTLVGRVRFLVDTAAALAEDRGTKPFREVLEWALELEGTVRSHARDAMAIADLSERLVAVAGRCERLIAAMDWKIVYNDDKKLFSIGLNAETNKLDASCYDLLASEARLASFVAIAGGHVPPSHWFRLGRRLTPVGTGSVLVSWSGSMFEYLMPELVMDVPEGSLLAQTDRLVVQRQIRYGLDRGVPWGVSEAAYNVRDLHMTYQYSNFGVAGLGLKQGLADDLVVAPYATALAAMVDPVAAADNFRRLEAAGASGRLGFYESVDYTHARLPDNATQVVVRAYMAHHQGMSIVALANVLGGYRMRRRFHAIPAVKATELLLQERTPRHVAVAVTHADEASMHLHVRAPVPPVLREFRAPNDPVPATHRLSNGRFSVSVTSAGGGQSRWEHLAISRWREDETLDRYGSFVYLRDVDRDRVWSAGYQPTVVEPDEYEAAFYEHRVEIRRRDGKVGTQLDVVVCPEDDAELRQITLVNHGHRPRTIEVTSYLELVLNSQGADEAHPAFSNLFVQTEFEPSIEAILATRRPRSSSEKPMWAAHVCRVHGAPSEGVQFETDRVRFLGRGREARNPSAVVDGRPLSNTVGSVLDPIFSLRRRVTVQPGQTVRVVFVTLISPTRERALSRCDAYRDANAFERAVSAAWTHAQVQLRHLGIDAEEAHLYQRLGSRLHTVKSGLRAPRDVIARNHQGQSALWRFGISGDRPILLGMVASGDDRELVRQLVHAQAYLGTKGLVVDVVLLNEQVQTYGQDLQAMLEALVRTSHLAGLAKAVHLVRSDHLSPEDHDLLLATARVVLSPRNGTLAEQVTRLLGRDPGPPPRRATLPSQPEREVVPPRLELSQWNGLGGFEDGGRTYTIVLGARQWTPMPWSNIVANDGFGFLVTEAGGGYTWAENAHENQLTAWSNDPVSDHVPEAIYLRDETTGEIWTPTPLPVREDTPYVVRHGQGFTRFEHESHGIALDLWQLVAADDPIKISRLVIRNTSTRTRQISVAAYVGWVLGPSKSQAAPHVVTAYEDGTITAHNPWKADFASGIAFFDMGPDVTSWTCDRADFIGRNGSLAWPAALARPTPGNRRAGAAIDPCGMLWRKLELDPGQSAVVTVLLGQARDANAVRALVARYRQEPWEDVLGLVRMRWDEMLGTVQVRTPDRGMDTMLNRWLLYQTLACRLWARTGFYQSSGAYGFRDQLQDVLAVVLARPDVARAQLLRAAEHQFEEGDVQHWWHPPASKGVRTRFSDDRVWLPYCAAEYVAVTGDAAVLDEVVPFLHADPLAPGAEDAYLEPTRSDQKASLYEHAARALDVSMGVGRHGLPLIGAGDWNDGMNRVGNHGDGESVWLAWFLLATLDRWIPIATARRDARAATWTTFRDQLKAAVEGQAWDGDWYRRAYMDDGTPLGSASNVECRIDSIAQSWSVLSRAGDPKRAKRAMASVDEHLVRRSDGIILLLTPPFDKTPLDPGYIKGYVPGVRENGGQYTHAAAWAIMAFAELGDGNRAQELFALINPIRRTETLAGVQRYKIEPYVLAGDVYGGSGHVGRGGWSWYTGSSAWMYRAGVEWILGLRVRDGKILVDPCIPASWPAFELTLTLREGEAVTRYEIAVANPDGVQRGVRAITLDGRPVSEIPLVRDAATHRVTVTLGATDG